MKQRYIYAFAFLLAACGRPDGNEAKEEADHHEATENGRVAITQQQMQAVGMELDTIPYKNLTAAIKANGLLTVPNQNKALVTSVSNGVIQSLLVQPGNFVRQGQVIATIINPDVVKLQQELQVTQAQLAMAEKEYHRQKELVEGNAAPLKNLQRTETELATLTATRNALQQQLAALGISAGAVAGGKVVTTLAVKAPISGTISEILAQIGSNVDAQTPIAQIVNNSQLHLDLFVYEKDLPKIKANQTIHFTVTNNAGKEYDAEIYSIGTAFVSSSKTIPVHAIVKGDKSGLIEGMSITAVVSIGKAVVPAVPSEAIVANGGQDYLLMLVAGDGHAHDDDHDAKAEGAAAKHTAAPVYYFEKVPVVKGTSDIGFTEIIPVKALPAGARIVTKGAFFVMAAMTNTGEHEH